MNTEDLIRMILIATSLLAFAIIVISSKPKNINGSIKWKHISFRQLEVGMRIRVNIGFSNFKQEGIIQSVHKGEDNYVWLKDETGRLLTASASYGNFEINTNPPRG